MSVRVLAHVNAFLDEQVFPRVVAFISSRPHILFLLLLLVPLLDPWTPAVLMLMLGNWTNVGSASASAIVLRQQSEHHDTVLDHHEAHADAFDQLLAEIATIKAHLGIPTEGETA